MAKRTPTLGRRRPHMRSHHWRSAVLTALLALGAGGIAASAVARAEATADAFGTRRSVAVATRDLLPGTRIGPGDVTWRDLPVGALPDGGVVDEPAGRVVVATVLAGEALPPARVGPEGLQGAAALVPEGGRALAIPVELPHPPVHVGDLVDLQAGPVTVARGATVVDAGEQAITVAVAGREVAVTAQALLDSRIVVALVGAR